MRRVASGIRIASGLALTATWAACGGEAFTAAADLDGATESSTPSDGVAPSADARVEDGGETGSTLVDVAQPPGDAPVTPLGCPTGRGPVMVLVDGFCIDATEVTTAQYNDFLLTGPPLSGQPDECSWNASYLPGNGWTFTLSQGTLPIANVNWCDAYAFCKWAGKRLCGKLGGDPADFSQFASKDNEHYLACSNVATRIYPYGNTFDPTACNGLDRQAGHVLPVGSLAGCQGGVPGLFDIAGNVEEWQDACNGNSGPDDLCLNGTGAFDFGDPPTGTRCDFSDSDARSGVFSDVGVRCCATPP